MMDTIYSNLTDAGRELAGKSLPMTRHFNGLPMTTSTAAPRGICPRKPEPFDKYHARIMAAAVKGQDERLEAYIGRPDAGWTLRATNGTIAVFNRDYGINDRPPLSKPIATIDRPIAFELTPDLELAIKRAKIVSAPRKFIALTIGDRFVDVIGDDFNGTNSVERVTVSTVIVDQQITIIADPDLLLLLFGSRDPIMVSMDPAIGCDVRCPSLSVDLGVSWRYVIALAKPPAAS